MCACAHFKDSLKACCGGLKSSLMGFSLKKARQHILKAEVQRLGACKLLWKQCCLWTSEFFREALPDPSVASLFLRTVTSIDLITPSKFFLWLIVFFLQTHSKLKRPSRSCHNCIVFDPTIHFFFSLHEAHNLHSFWPTWVSGRAGPPLSQPLLTETIVWNKSSYSPTMWALDSLKAQGAADCSNLGSVSQ